MNCAVWKPRPNPGDMALCQNCPHHRDDERRDHRCAITRHSPYLPPLVELRGGKEHCGWWPPKHEPADPNQLSLLGVEA